MNKIAFPQKNEKAILALGAESAGNFSVFQNGKLFSSSNFGDLLEEKNWKKYQKSVLEFLKKEKIKPDVILSDFHPDFKTTLWAKKLSKRFEATHLQIQHHLAHTFSAIGNRMIEDKKYVLPKNTYSIVMDGTGLGTDEKIWGGEVFKIESQSTSRRTKVKRIERIGHLENQRMLGGELAIQEPARMLMGILAKFLSKKEVYEVVNKYYNPNEFELLWNQLEQKFNCPETSSTGRVLDATSLLLGFCQNQRKFKHEPTFLLEKNSTSPFHSLKPKIINKNILSTTHLFKYILKYILKPVRRKKLAATAQLYVAQGLFEIAQKSHSKFDREPSNNSLFISGGLSENKLIESFLVSKGAWKNRGPAGDAGISLGQIVYYLLANPRD